VSPRLRFGAWSLMHTVAFTLTTLSQRGRECRLSRWRLAATAALFALAASVWPSVTFPSKPPATEPLPRIGPAPPFTLTDQDGKRFTLRDLRGRVAVVTFIFTTCSDTCPLLTAKLVGIERKLGPADPVFFVEITVDPVNDSPAVLKKYADGFAAPPTRFAFLTGDFDEIHKVVRSYGVYYKQTGNSGIDHTFLTSIVDRSGTLRVQYLGSRFDPNEFLGDLRSLLEEAPGK
jgi:protein SCO1